MKGLFIPEITAEMFRNGCLESIEQLMAEGEIYDIDYPLKQEPKTDVLDKISAEINEYGSLWVEYKIIGHTDRDIEKIVEDVLKQAKEQVLEIIDKYKAESEGK